MSCKKCQDGYIYTCSNCSTKIFYDYEFGRAFCDTCEMLEDRYMVYKEICPNCINQISTTDLKSIALKYHELGFNTTCITKSENEFNRGTSNFFKTPSHPWDHLSKNEQSLNEIDNFNWKEAVGVGTITKWKKLVAIDLDGCNDNNVLYSILQKLGLPSNYEWVIQSGSKNGFHILILSDKIKECKDDDVVSTFPPKVKYEKYFDKIEFLWETHCVLPPSVHGSGNRYKFLNKVFPENRPQRVDNKLIYELIEEYLEYDQIVNGQSYGGLTHKILANEEFVSEIKNDDLTKYLIDEIYCIVDIETTGFPQKVGGTVVYPDILQIAWVLTNSKGVLIKKKSYIVKSDFFSKNEYSNILNIDFEVAAIVGYDFKEIMKRFVEDIKVSDYIVAHNINFDIDILSHHFLILYGIDPLKKKQMICTMKSTVEYCKIPGNFGYKFPKLSELFLKLFDYEITNSHNAEIDVLHTLKCFKKLKKIGVI